ncbi:MAG: hypothetical protein ABIP03_02385 [Aquihabitans sp.]
MTMTPSTDRRATPDPTSHLPWRDHPWVDVPVAAVSAVLLLNVHVTDRGDMLSSLERSERRGFYAVLAILAVVLIAATATRHFPAERWCRGYLGFVASSAIAALLLDVQDGPVRTVQLLALVGLSLALTTTTRFILSANGPAATSPGP